MKFRLETLDNGLEIVAEENPAAHSLALGYFVKTGSRDETNPLAGVSHFLEHMVFKGTARRSAEDVNREFDELGAHYNAFTSEENTVYYGAVLPEYQTPIVDLLTDLMRPSLRDDDFATEKQVILEEILMYEDQPPYGADDKCRARFFADHPLGKSVLGFKDTIEALSAEQMREYHERRYSPGNIALVASGKVDFDALCRQVEASTKHWKPMETAREIAPARVSSGRLQIMKAQSTQSYCVSMSQGPDSTASDRYSAKALAMILGDDTGSRLFWELVDPGLVEHASFSHHEFQGAGAFYLMIACAPQDMDEAIAKTQQIFASVRSEGVRADELEQAKSKVNSRIVLASERPRGRLFNVGSNWLQRREYRSVRDDLHRVEALTIGEVNAVAAKYPLTEASMVIVGPETN